MFKFQKQRVNARKILLNRSDQINFDSVPDFIVDAFFGSCTYKNRLIVTTFGYLNGIYVDDLLKLTKWTDTTEAEKSKVKRLYLDYETPRYRENYYSFNVHNQLVMYLNGDIRKHGKRIPKTNEY